MEKENIPVQSPQIKEILKEFHTSPTGLSASQVKERQKIYGFNFFSVKKKSPIFLFLSKFFDPLILILLFTSAVAAVIGDLTDFLVIFIILFLSVCIDFYLEFASQKAADNLKKQVENQAFVLRDGIKKEIPVASLTYGDIVFLVPGDIVPADLKILSARDFHLDQSILTGEAFPAEKNDFEEIFMGTSVVNGQAFAIVSAVGRETQFGHIVKTLSDRKPKTDFENNIHHFGVFVMRLTAILVAVIFLFNALVKHDLFDSLLFSLAIAIGIAPELLPMIVTFNLGKGALRMAKKNVIVKHLPSIQNFGSMNVLCTDKTGTLTENQITLSGFLDIKGESRQEVIDFAYLNSFFQSNQKNPIDLAILKAELKINTKDFEKIDELPFDFNRRRLSVILKHATKHLLVSKGAPEDFLEICRLNPDQKENLHKLFEKEQKQGFRLIAVGYKEISAQKSYKLADENNLTFLGVVKLFDPPKEGVKEILAKIGGDGIVLKVLTGDSLTITKIVCEKLGIPSDKITTGDEFEKMDLGEQKKIVQEVNIFARVNPLQKVKIIQMLKLSGKTVGFLGDGVNDAASLKEADIGISVNNAVDIAKEAADIILLKKSLAVLEEGVIEGRKTFTNVMKYLIMVMGSSFGNMLSLSLASFFLPFIPLLPVQVLINDLLYDASQFALPFDHVDHEELIKPRNWSIDFIKKFTLVFGPISTVFDLLTFFVILKIFRGSAPFLRTGWFLESIFTQLFIMLSFRTKKVPFFKSKIATSLIFTISAICLLAIIISQTALKKYFQFVSLPGYYWLFLGLVMIGYFLLNEIVKKFFYQKLSSSSQQ